MNSPWLGSAPAQSQIALAASARAPPRPCPRRARRRPAHSPRARHAGRATPPPSWSWRTGRSPRGTRGPWRGTIPSSRRGCRGCSSPRQRFQNSESSRGRGVVVEDDEVAHVLEQVLHLPVVFVALDRVESACPGTGRSAWRCRSGSDGCWSIRAARRSRWTAPSQTTLRLHASLAPAGGEATGARGSASGSPSRLSSSTFSASSSLIWSLAIDVAVAHPVLERDAPLPARAARGRAGEGIGRARIGARHRDRAVAAAASASSPRSRPSAPARSAAPRKPEQSMNRSPSTLRPSSSVTDSTNAVLAAQRDVDDLALDAG